jgi:trans-2,3-dihydro-3-hydroxyanthranilate isomerase
VIVLACRRDGRGGSPTTVLDGEGSGRRADPRTSHTVLMTPTAPDAVRLRFLTATGELPACGHGTVAALAVLASRSPTGACTVQVAAGGRLFTGHAHAAADGFDAAFDPGPVTTRTATPGERDAALAGLGLSPTDLAGEPTVASVGRARLLVPVADRSVVAALRPDLAAVAALPGLLGCYVHTPPTASGRLTARMFAPAIGIGEDIANANSTACLAALHPGRALTVDMGDALGSPSSIVALARRTDAGLTLDVGGHAALAPGRR